MTSNENVFVYESLTTMPWPLFAAIVLFENALWWVRPVMKMTLSSDHRVIDGAVAAQFMKTLKEILEDANF
mgnify:CR=1 FL=1